MFDQRKPWEEPARDTPGAASNPFAPIPYEQRLSEPVPHAEHAPPPYPGQYYSVNTSRWLAPTEALPPLGATEPLNVYTPNEPYAAPSGDTGASPVIGAGGFPPFGATGTQAAYTPAAPYAAPSGDTGASPVIGAGGFPPFAGGAAQPQADKPAAQTIPEYLRRSARLSPTAQLKREPRQPLPPQDDDTTDAVYASPATNPFSTSYAPPLASQPQAVPDVPADPSSSTDERPQKRSRRQREQDIKRRRRAEHTEHEPDVTAQPPQPESSALAIPQDEPAQGDADTPQADSFYPAYDEPTDAEPLITPFPRYSPPYGDADERDADEPAAPFAPDTFPVPRFQYEEDEQPDAAPSDPIAAFFSGDPAYIPDTGNYPPAAPPYPQDTAAQGYEPSYDPTYSQSYTTPDFSQPDYGQPAPDTGNYPPAAQGYDPTYSQSYTTPDFSQPDYGQPAPDTGSYPPSEQCYTDENGVINDKVRRASVEAQPVYTEQPEPPAKTAVRPWRLVALIAIVGMSLFLIISGGILLSRLASNDKEIKEFRSSYIEENGVSPEDAASLVVLPKDGSTFAPTPVVTAQPVVTDSPAPIFAIEEPSVEAMKKRDEDNAPDARSASLEPQPSVTPTPAARTKLTGYPDNPMHNIMESMRELVKEYPDVVGRLVIANVLDEIVVQKNNTYYLTHDYRGADSRAGAVFVDESCALKIPPENLLLRGQSVVEGKVFAPLLQYQTSGGGFVSASAIARLTTLYEEQSYALFAVIVADTDPSSSHYFNFASNPTFATDEEMLRYVDNARRMSLYQFNVGVQTSDRLLTLATVGNEGQTMVLIFRALRAGEGVR